MMRLARLCTPMIVVGLVMVFAAGAASAQGSEPLNGTWKLNRAKSTFSPGPAPRSDREDRSIDAVRKSPSMSLQRPQRPSIGRFPERPAVSCPSVGNNPNADVYVLKRVNATTLESQCVKGGKPTLKETAVVSADGNTLTVTASGTDAQGRPIHNVAVYYK